MARVFNSGMLFHLLLHFEMGLNDIAPLEVERFIDAALDSMLNGLQERGAGSRPSVPGCDVVSDWLETGIALLHQGALTGVLGDTALPGGVKPSTPGSSKPEKRSRPRG
jgi:hypothetical protein